jgi:phosphinothricin acetyltransferase
MIIRDATIADLPAIVEIYNSTVAGRMVTADTEPVSAGSKEKWFHEHGPLRPLWVIEEAGHIIAWVSFQSFYGRPAYRHTAEISIYIAESERGKGLGVKLLDYSLSKCEALEIKTLLGFIFGHNVPSLMLFQKFGFETMGKFPRVAEMDGKAYDLLILGKRIYD